jgi:hypothetical protein
MLFSSCIFPSAYRKYAPLPYGFGPVEIGFCGKHMLFREMLALTTIDALTSSLGG